jgi:hypothetical protein
MATSAVARASVLRTAHSARAIVGMNKGESILGVSPLALPRTCSFYSLDAFRDERLSKLPGQIQGPRKREANWIGKATSL